MPSLLVVHARDQPGDAVEAALRIAPLLLQRGWQITMTSPSGRRPAGVPDAVVWRQQAVGGTGRTRGAGALLAYGAFRSLAARHDVVYFNGSIPARLLPALQDDGWVAGAARTAGRLRGLAKRYPADVPQVRTLLHLHGLPGHVPRFFATAGALMADTQALATPLARRLGREVTVTGWPVDPDPPSVAPPWRPDGRPTVAFVGPFTPQAGPLDLVVAADAVRAAVPEARILLVEEGHDSIDPAYARLLVEQADAHGVERWSRPADRGGLLRHVDVLVVPAHREPRGVIAAQALALGVPVVATAADGLVEVVDDGVTGRLVPPGDPAALAHGTIWALRNHQLLRGAGIEVAQRWSPDAVAARVEAVLLAGDGRPSGPDSTTVAPPAEQHR